ncbi:MAG: YitT family protein [Tissierellales bacterium]|nr:YitT family protein [Tissierellales bacterium]
MNKIIKELSILFLAAFCLALGVVLFLAPNNIAAGGTTGIAIIIKSYAPNANIGLLMMIMDVCLYIVGFWLIGPVFSFRTMFCSFSTSIITAILVKYFPVIEPMSSDVLIQLIMGIVLCSLGMGIAFSQDASTGGLDIVVKILNKYFHTSMPLGVLIVDTLIIAGAITTFGAEKGLYAMFGVVLLCICIRNIMAEISMHRRVIVLGENFGPISEYITRTLGGSATIYDAKDGLTNDKKSILITSLSRSEINKLKNYAHSLGENMTFILHPVEQVPIGATVQ